MVYIQPKIVRLSLEFREKLLKDENIIEEKDKLKELQILLIYFLSLIYNFYNGDCYFLNNFYHKLF